MLSWKESFESKKEDHIVHKYSIGRKRSNFQKKKDNLAQIWPVKMAKISINSVIAWIHRTNVASHTGIELLVEAELIQIARWLLCRSEINFPPQSLSLITYPKSRNPRDQRKMDQLLSEVVGLEVLLLVAWLPFNFYDTNCNTLLILGLNYIYMLCWHLQWIF